MAGLSLPATLCETVVSNTPHRQLDVSFHPTLLLSHTLLLTDYMSVLAHRQHTPAQMESGMPVFSPTPADSKVCIRPPRKHLNTRTQGHSKVTDRLNNGTVSKPQCVS